MVLYDKKVLENGLKWQVLVASSEPVLQVQSQKDKNQHKKYPKKTKYASVAQWIEHESSKLGVIGSSPIRRTTKSLTFRHLQRLLTIAVF